jgi:hypothetical protein
MIENIAAIIVVVLFSLLTVFQFLLALGLPLGHLAYGGKHEKLPRNLRISSIVAIGIFIFGSLEVLENANLITLVNIPLVSLITVWILAIYLTLNTLMNLLSKSKKEKLIMTPISLIAAICCYIIAILP